MHEMSLMESLMSQILEVAEREKASKVTKVKVWLGAMSHMSPSHFKEHFDQVAEGLICQDAALDCVVSKDMHHPHAQSILLESVDVACD